MSSRTWSLLLACLAAVAFASPAQAVSRYRIGRGEAPGVAIDAAGVAHIAFNAEYVNGVGQPVMYCAVPKGARKCTPRPILSDGDSALAQPALVSLGPAPGELWVTSVREENRIVYVHSLDNGATWSPAVQIGEGRYFDGAFGPGGQIAFAFREEFRLRSLTTPPDDSAMTPINEKWPQGNSVVGWFKNRPVVVTGGANPGFAVSSWSGTGDVHDPATWFGPYKIGSSNYFALAGGRAGCGCCRRRSSTTRPRRCRCVTSTGASSAARTASPRAAWARRRSSPTASARGRAGAWRRSGTPTCATASSTRCRRAASTGRVPACSRRASSCRRRSGSRSAATAAASSSGTRTAATTSTSCGSTPRTRADVGLRAAAVVCEPLRGGLDRLTGGVALDAQRERP